MLNTAGQIGVSSIRKRYLTRVAVVIVKFTALLHSLILVIDQWLSLVSLKRVLILQLVCSHSLHLSLLHGRLASSWFGFCKLEGVVGTSNIQDLWIVTSADMVLL